MADNDLREDSVFNPVPTRSTVDDVAIRDLAAVATKVADWFERQAARDEQKAKTERFITLRDAYIFDAKNYRAMARDLRGALAKAVPGTDARQSGTTPKDR